MAKEISQAKIWGASFTMLGSIVGAGILGIPYVVAQTGWWIGLFHLIFIGAIALLMNLMVGEIASRTKGNVHLPGYVEKYLGGAGKKIMMLAFVINIYGAMLAYIIAEGETLYSLTGILSPYIWSLLFFGIGSLGVYAGIKFLAKINTQLVIALLACIAIIVFWAFFSIDITNYTGVNWSAFAAPYGVLLFAYGGTFVLPTVEQMVGEKEKAFRKAIIIASVLPIIIYTVFTFIVIGVTGTSTTQVATIGLGENVGAGMLFFGNIFAFLAMATSFLSLGVTLKNMWQWDMKLSNIKATLAVLVLPLGLFLLGWREFISVLSFFGALGTGIMMVLSVIVFWRIRKVGGEVKIKYAIPCGGVLGWSLITIALLGFISTLWALL